MRKTVPDEVSEISWYKNWWGHYVKTTDTYIAFKFNRASAILSKLRPFIDTKTMKAMYHTIFELHSTDLSYISYCLLWTLSLFTDPISKMTLFVLHKKSSQFLHFLSHCTLLFKLLTEYSILKLPDKTALENFPFLKNISKTFSPNVWKLVH